MNLHQNKSNESFKINANNQFTTDAYERFKYQLNFKYIDAQAQLMEKRQGFNKKNTYSPIIENIKDLNKANQVIIFTASNKIWNLKEEINNIGALGYVLKESPMMNLNRTGSIELYQDFVRLVKNAVKLSTLRELVKFQEYLVNVNKQMETENSEVDLNGVYNSIELLLLDKHLFDKTNSNKYNPSQEIVKSVILNQVVFVETYLKKKYTTTLEPKVNFSNGKRMAVKEVSLNKSDIKHNVLGHIFLQSEFDDGYSRVKDVLLSNAQLTEAPSGWNYLSESTQNKNKDLSIMLSAAYGFYSFDEQRLKLLAKMKDIRNSYIAHHGGSLDIPFEEIRDFYIDIIGAILKQDYKI